MDSIIDLEPIFNGRPSLNRVLGKNRLTCDLGNVLSYRYGVISNKGGVRKSDPSR
ncbi:MAG: hypothetical protein ACRD6Q_09005 [Nitrososphaeraceae archaeon]